MNRYGVIGVGSMGSVLVNCLQRAGCEVVIARRGDTLDILLSTCTFIFISVKPHDYRAVLEQLAEHVNERHIIISITSPVMIAQLERWLPNAGGIAKVIPSLTNSVAKGATCWTANDRLRKLDNGQRLQQLLHVLNAFSTPLEIAETQTRIVSDLSSCGPAFISYFIHEWINAAHRHTGVQKQEALDIVRSMLEGTAALLHEHEGRLFTPASIMQRISVPGGITQYALTVFDGACGGGAAFDALVRATHSKFEDDVIRIEHLLTK